MQRDKTNITFILYSFDSEGKIDAHPPICWKEWNAFDDPGVLGVVGDVMESNPKLCWDEKLSVCEYIGWKDTKRETRNVKPLGKLFFF